MTFHFQCPYGHLLAGEETQAGQQCMCPVCTTLFIIPAPLAATAPASTMPEPEPASSTEEAASPFAEFGDFETKVPKRAPVRPSEPAPEETPEPAPPEPAAPVMSIVPEVVHIPCPNGHLLEMPAEMLDHEVLCPLCQVQFRLRRQDSQEYKQKKRDERARKERRGVEIWIVCAVVVVVGVVLGLFYLIVHSSAD